MPLPSLLDRYTKVSGRNNSYENIKVLTRNSAGNQRQRQNDFWAGSCKFATSCTNSLFMEPLTYGRTGGGHRREVGSPL